MHRQELFGHSRKRFLIRFITLNVGYEGGYTAVSDYLRQARPFLPTVFERRFETPPDAEIKTSIKALGLLENFVVLADPENADGTGRHAVIAGGCRLKALQELAGEGAINPDHPVPPETAILTG